MLAARLEAVGTELEVKRVARPELPPDGVRVRVLAAQVLPFSAEVIAGSFPFPLPTPYTFGSSAVGIVEEVADGVSGFALGERVFCDPYLPGEQPDGERAPLLIGWFALSDAARATQLRWRDGAFAEEAVYPAVCCTPLRGLDHIPAERLACLNYLGIAYGALRRAALRPGETVLVTGATGNLGSAAVLDALALGAGRVLAAGRNEAALAELAQLDAACVRTVRLSGDVDADAAAFARAATADGGTGLDAAIDCVGLSGGTAHLVAALRALKPRGRLVVAGGVGGAFELDYQTLLARELSVMGSFMGPREGPRELAALARARRLSLEALRPRVFALREVQRAIEAAPRRHALEFTVLAMEHPETATEEAR